MNQTIELINKRRSVRAWESKPITKEDLDTIIHAAMRAPTAGNQMLYSILQVDDQEKKEKLVKTCDNQPMIAKAPLVLIFLADMQRWYDFYASSNVKELCKRRNITYRTPKESDLMIASCDALIAAQNSVIAAESLGIGSCYVGDIMENIEIHREMFNLPKWVFPITMLCFGYPKSKNKNPKLTPRFDEKYIHFHDEYKRFQKDDFDDMFKKYNEEFEKMGNKPSGVENYGQRFYIYKTGSEFAQEMERSVKVVIKDWNEAES
ncbi:MAG: nitroreductase [Promethearchaeia archaeon]|nr:MAG: nitroreductase [Candidatus Lokiarchaeia archaeon]